MMARTASSKSSLSSVVDYEQVKEFGWRKLDKNDPLTQLHAKFWGQGQGLVEGVKAKEPPTQAMPTSDPSSYGSQKLDELVNATDECDLEDDDITADCFGLEIGSQAFKINKIWVRAEYIRMYNFIVEYYASRTKYPGPAPSVVLFGQPGVGKSVFLFYVLYRCLVEKRPVIWRYLNSPHLFFDGGVYNMGSRFLADTYKGKIWTLIDADEDPYVLEKFVPHFTPFFVIYAGSSSKDRWSRLHKTTKQVVVVMNPWTRSEMHRAAELEELDPKIVDDAYDQLGPIPHLCLRTAFDPQDLKMYKDDLHRIAKHMTPQSFEELLRKVMNWNMDDVSRKICLIKRPKRNNVRHFFRVQPITDSVQSKIAISLRDLDVRQQFASYQYIARISSLNGMTGPMFEGFCHGRFQKTIFIHYIPMVCMDKKEWKDQPQWYSSHSPIQNLELEVSHQDSLHCRATLDVCPSHTCEYTDKDLPELDPEEDVYYVPAVENLVPHGSFILHGDRLYMFQFTCYNAHDIKAGLISRFAGCTKFPSPDKWRFIFVIPGDTKGFKCKYQQTPELQGLKLFLAQVAMDDAQGQVAPLGSSKKRSPPSIKEGKEGPPSRRSKVTC